ncbi:MAG: ABC transporter ATP-binding protein, partial [Chitinophagaceae bacterium]|nr:ABC transporter ATP-binding protein [Chitinophagaceae bacterium]
LLTILFKNPNFLVLDEPTNDLDLQTLQLLEEFLQEYQGCILIVSHDRYFMDKLVDHLFVFEGDGVIADFPGNYTQYRIRELSKDKDKEPLKSASHDESKTEVVKQKTEKISYKEKREFETLEAEMPVLTQEKATLELAMSDSNTSYDDLQKAAARIGEIIQLLEEKEMRWLELSEKLDA